MRFFPKHEDFFADFEKGAANTLEAAKFLDDNLQNGLFDEEKLKILEEYEHKGDDITHDTLGRLNRTFVTPIDREDIHHMVSRVDDVMDFMHSAGEALCLYKVLPIPTPIKEFSLLLVKITTEVYRAVGQLSNLKHPKRIMNVLVEIHRHENEADNLKRRALADLFENEKDPIRVIKIKEILEDLETATDKCEDVANVIEAIILKNA